MAAVAATTVPNDYTGAIAAPVVHYTSGASRDVPNEPGHVRASRAAAEKGDAAEVIQLIEQMRHAGSVDEAWSARVAAQAAAMHGHAHVLRALFENEWEACLSAADAEGKTPAHMAAERGHPSCLEALYKFGAAASFSSPDAKGYTPGHEAAASGNDDCLRVIDELGPERSLIAEDTKGDTPADLAKINGHGRCLHLLQKFAHVNRTADDLFHKARAAAKETGTAGSPIGRVVLDDRMVVQDEPPLGRSEYGSRGSKPIPHSARNDGLIVDAEVRAVGSWRGRGFHIPARESREFETAARVVGSACRMTAAVRAEQAVDDANWKTDDGAAMTELTGTADPTEQAECFVRLAQVVQRIIERQSTVVTVAAPAKVFGDIHGQLRDLLALFARYGFPTHRGGDVESMSYVFNG